MRRLAVLLVAAVTAATTVLVGAAPAHAAGPTLPSADPFYQYANTAQGKAGVPLASIPPGTVLAERTVDLGLGTQTAPTPTGLPLPATLPTTAEQLLYRTADEQGRPSVTVTTVIEPATGAVAPKIVAYLSFYDALSGKCDPSFTLQGGDPGSANQTLTEAEQALVEAYAADAVVTVPDFEGEGLDWTAGYEAGYDTLDAIRATESYLEAPASTDVGLTGYSGGSIAADWASELAPAYAPELNIVGVAEGGIPVDFAHNLVYINGSQDWSGVIPAVLEALGRAFGLDLPTYLSPLGMQLTAKDRTECIGEFSGTTPGLTIAQLLKPQYQDILHVAAFDDIINKLIMGTAPGHPKGPLLMGVGNDPKNAQGQGDDVMVTADVEALAHEYCSQGVQVEYHEYQNSSHEQAALQFEPEAIAFLQQRFAGVPFTTSSCASIGPGSSLAPLTPSAGTTPPSAATTRPPAGGTTTASGRTAGGDLAFTGTDPAVALVALALVAGGATGLGLRRRTRRR
ncbi:MAG TPA: lipase family protein [Mycobacteriales bacterium]